MGSPQFARATVRSTALSIGIVAVVALLAASVRLLPWVLSKTVPLRVAIPFARGLASLALEVAMVVGLPLGWAMAAYRFWERGEARVLALLGERPERSIARLAPLSLVFVAILSGASWLGGNEGTDPGRIANQLVEQARAACSHVKRATAMSVPFTELSWLCRPAGTPRLVGPPPLAPSGLLMTATNAEIESDFRKISLDDAHVSWTGGGEGAIHANVAVRKLVLHGLSPWSHASDLPTPVRVAALSLIALVSGAVTVAAVFAGTMKSRMRALVCAAAGPLSGLGLMRLLERANSVSAAYALPPLLALVATTVFALLLAPRWRFQGYRDRRDADPNPPTHTPPSLPEVGAPATRKPRSCNASDDQRRAPDPAWGRLRGRKFGTNMGNLGIGEIVVIGLIALVLFGSNKFAEVGKGLGQGIKNFKQGLKEAEELDKKPALPEKDSTAKPS